jgi:hypothetical protein
MTASMQSTSNLYFLRLGKRIYVGCLTHATLCRSGDPFCFGHGPPDMDFEFDKSRGALLFYASSPPQCHASLPPILHLPHHIWPWPRTTALPPPPPSRVCV